MPALAPSLGGSSARPSYAEATGGTPIVPHDTFTHGGASTASADTQQQGGHTSSSTVEEPDGAGGTSELLSTNDQVPLYPSGFDPNKPYPTPTSCSEMVGNECGNESCCNSIALPDGTLPMGRSENGSDAFPLGRGQEQPEHIVTISAFRLDKFEITVARFRQYVESYLGTPPPEGSGMHPRIENSGWQSGWNSSLPASRDLLKAQLKCHNVYQTWTDTRSTWETLPINCVNWYVAFAFCIWDGGRLPTEAEWEYAAVGGSLNRLYPWGSNSPTAEYANYDCSGADSASVCHANDIRPVGSRPKGAGFWKHLDLAGSMLEFTRDSYDPSFFSSTGATGNDVANLAEGHQVVARGGNYLSDGADLRGALRNNVIRDSTWDGVGIRCARDY